MAKKIFSFLMLLISVFTLTSTFKVEAEEVSLENIEEMRGVWVSTVGNLDFRIKQNTTSEADIQKWKNSCTSFCLLLWLIFWWECGLAWGIAGVPSSAQK